jgi:5-methylcytosine-specific restriction protein A
MRRHPKPGLCRDCERERRPNTTQRGLGSNHQRIRRQVLAEENLCWICGQPARPDDPLTADHVLSRAAGGRNTRSNYRAAHYSCNSSRGARSVSLEAHAADPRPGRWEKQHNESLG